MISALGNLAFLNPWALLSLLALPVLYFLLKITPPAPRVIQFPAARFLADLQPKQNTPNKTPWWILLLRLLMMALLLIALARPVLNPVQADGEQGPLLLLIDNGWAAAQNWDDIQEAAENHIQQTGRKNRVLYVLSTAPEAGKPAPKDFEPMTSAEALSYVRALQPYPWNSDLKALFNALRDYSAEVLWLSDGFEKSGQNSLLNILKKSGARLSVYAPKNSALAFALKPTNSFEEQPTIVIDGARDIEFTRPLRVQLLGQRGNILDEITLETREENLPIEAVFDLPLTLQNSAASFRIAAQKHAAARYLLDTIGGPKTVGIVAAEEQMQTRQLTEDSFYLGKALGPYASVFQDTLNGVIEQKPSVIILPDIASMPPEQLNALSDWVNDGGLLLRFAGPNMTQARDRDILTPVPLRREARNVEGSLSWDNALKIKPIEAGSPLYGLSGYEEIEVSGQILSQPSEELNERTWAQLEDGTPFITAAQREVGLIVMVHTTAAPTWSNLPLSGFYVQLLKRLLKFSGQTQAISQDQSGQLQPQSIMDGFGDLAPPAPSVLPIDAGSADALEISPEHPPGFYGRGGLQRAFNIGDGLRTLRSINAEGGLDVQPFGQVFEQDLAPSFLLAALFLFLIDALVMFFIARGQSGMFSNLMRGTQKAAIVILLLCFTTSPSPSHAQNAQASQDLYLAYIKTGSPIIDSTSEKGLEVLVAALNGRTSAEPSGVRAVNPEVDTLSFFPLIYWALSPAQQPPSSKALQKLQDYLDHGGTILVDTRDGSGNTGGSPEILRTMLGGLNIPPLMELPEDHVLTKSFYLLERFPGRTDGASLWVEGQSINGRDGVSSVIIGSHDWAGAWAELNILQRGNRTFIQGATERHEMSLRFGVNLVMYALTGNYKADQVHVPHILERLGREE